MNAATTDRLPEVLTSLGTPNLATTLFAWLHDALLVDEYFVFARPFDLDDAPSSILALGTRPYVEERTSAYCSQFHKFDPINHALSENAIGTQGMRVSPTQITDTRYRSVCYERPRLSEKISLWRRNSSHWIVASFFRSAGARGFSYDDLDMVSQCGRLLFPLVDKHQCLLRFSGDQKLTKAMLIDRAVNRLALVSVKLTPRQIEVCARTAVGMTAHGIALELGIKSSSVVTHRRRAYERLGVAGGHELTRLLLN